MARLNSLTHLNQRAIVHGWQTKYTLTTGSARSAAVSLPSGIPVISPRPASSSTLNHYALDSRLETTINTLTTSFLQVGSAL